MSEPTVRTRRVIVVDNSHVARRVGERIRQARARLRLTQAQLAEGRYTAAYISALERGLAKPSMAALTFLSDRLGVSIPDLVAEERPAAGRLEADLLLASGKAQEALDRYDALLGSAGDDRRNRAELLRGRAEALCRLMRGHEAIRPASEAAELFDALAAPADAAWARYWLAGAHYLEDNPAEARSILQQLLAGDRAGLDVAPDFRFRLLTQLGNVEAWDGEWSRGLTYMEEARTLVDAASLVQRAAFLSGLALQYRRLGDLERSIRVGHESLALYHAADAERDEAALENNIAITFIELGNLARAEEHLARARHLAERNGDRSCWREPHLGPAREPAWRSVGCGGPFRGCRRTPPEPSCSSTASRRAGGMGEPPLRMGRPRRRERAVRRGTRSGKAAGLTRLWGGHGRRALPAEFTLRQGRGWFSVESVAGCRPELLPRSTA
jgi:tetratricopeptide (TPR) repeat protein